jgi:hypothetical protein
MDIESKLIGDTAEELNDFEFGEERVEFEVEVRGKRAKYLLRDIPAGEAEKLFNPMVFGSEAEKTKAKQRLRNKVISLVVLRSDGRSFTEEEAGKLRTPLAVKLSARAMEFLQVEDADSKKASTET